MAATRGQFNFTVAPIVTGDSNANDIAELREVIISFWQAYLQLDAHNYLDQFTPDALRLSSRATTRQMGQADIQAGLSAEWEAFERPNQRIAEQMVVTRAEFNFTGEVATAIYWVDIAGGVRWHYTDQGLIFQVFTKPDSRWQIVHHTDAWSLDYDVAAQRPGPGKTLDFAYAYPVKDLARAVRFYTPLLGKPESVTPNRASFNVKGGHFLLETSDWRGAARLRNKLPNGYALFQVNDVATEVARLAKAKVDFTILPEENRADKYAVGFDADQNLLILWEKDFNTSTDITPTMSGFPNGFTAQWAKRMMQAWLTMDVATITEYTSKGTWFDDTRLKQRGLERGKQIGTALQTVYWSQYDHGAGMAAKLEVSHFHQRKLDSHYLISYDMKLTGVGAHPFRDSAWVTQLFDDRGQALHTFIVDNNHSTNPVLELDYTGYPTQDIDAARKFYKNVMKLGEGYRDEGYYGFWSNHAVFGLYEADSEEDQLPQPHRANGYMSFWVHSAEAIYEYLKQNGSTFPVIPAINDRKGIDKQPGYTQVVSTDSEGNVLIFTEYSGRPR
jgi:catechol 2,3-dioxygenase-like lactoylglutathione lyase family enzyme/ketosteroid isomerase-like protein